MKDHNQAVQENLSRYGSTMQEIIFRTEQSPDDNENLDMDEARTELTNLVSSINKSCANPVLKKETFLRSELKNKERYRRSQELDENLQSEEILRETASCSDLQKLQQRKQELIQKINDEVSELEKVKERVKQTILEENHQEPADETEQTRLHRRNVVLSNILILLTGIVSNEVSSEEKQEIQELTESVLSHANHEA